MKQMTLTQGVLALFAGTALVVGLLLVQGALAQGDATPTPDHMDMMGGEHPMPAASPEANSAHEMMHHMMDMMHGEGTSNRMHEMMGTDGERMMDACAAMMAMMGMMGGQEMPGMAPATPTSGH